MTLTGPFGDKVIESTQSAPGTADFQLGGAFGNGALTHVAVIGDGKIAIYSATDATGDNWERGYGTVTAGAPDTLSRTVVLASSNGGAKVNFATAPTVFSSPAPQILNSLLSLHKGPSRPDWLSPGGKWLDDSADPVWTVKLWTGDDDIPFVDFDSTTARFSLRPMLGDLEIESADDGASAAPALTLYRNSSTPAANDLAGIIKARGKSDTGVDRLYAQLIAQILDPTNAAEDGQWILQAIIAGAMTTILTAGALGVLMNSKPIEFARGADVASAATTDIWSGKDGNTVAITGTETITSLGTAPQAGALRVCVAAGAFTLTHNPTTLALEGGANITAEVNDIFIVFATTTSNFKVVYHRASGRPLVPAHDYILIRDEKSDGTDGGTASSGAWRTRDLNTEVIDTGNHASVSSNQVTLAAGTYEIVARAPFNFVGGVRIRWRQVTDGGDAAISESASYGQTNTHVQSTAMELRGRFTIPAQKTFELQYFCEVNKTTDGLGADDDIAVGAEIYSTVELRKVA